MNIAGGVTLGADYPRWAKVAALTFTMIFEQPVVYEFQYLKVPTVLLVGLEDKTIVGKGMLIVFPANSLFMHKQALTHFHNCPSGMSFTRVFTNYHGRSPFVSESPNPDGTEPVVFPLIA